MEPLCLGSGRALSQASGTGSVRTCRGKGWGDVTWWPITPLVDLSKLLILSKHTENNVFLLIFAFENCGVIFEVRLYKSLGQLSVCLSLSLCVLACSEGCRTLKAAHEARTPGLLPKSTSHE